MTKRRCHIQAVNILGWIFGWYKNKKGDYVIPDGFDIHHIDCDWTNNSLDNLVVLTKEEHSAIHREDFKQCGKINGGYNKRSVLCVETGVVYESLVEAEKQTGTNNSHICSVLKGRRKTAGGYTWRYIEE